MEKEIRKCDIYVGIIIFMVIGIHMMTNFYMSYQSEVLGADIESTVKYYEMNPFVEIQLLSDKFLTVIFTIVKPGIVMFFYWLLRKRTIEGKVNLHTLQSYIMLFFFVLVTNFLNDFSVIAGMLSKGYGG